MALVLKSFKFLLEINLCAIYFIYIYVDNFWLINTNHTFLSHHTDPRHNSDSSPTPDHQASIAITGASSILEPGKEDVGLL